MDPLEPLDTFLYLGCTIANNNSDWGGLYQNLVKVRRWWGTKSRVLEEAGETERDRSVLYKSLVHMVPLYGIKS